MPALLPIGAPQPEGTAGRIGQLVWFSWLSPFFVVWGDFLAEPPKITPQNRLSHDAAAPMINLA
jgi:hypothetical protein